MSIAIVVLILTVPAAGALIAALGFAIIARARSGGSAARAGILVGLFCGVLGAASLIALGGVVSGEESCDIGYGGLGLSGTARLLSSAMSIGVFGGFLGLFVGFAIASTGALFGRRHLLALETSVIAALAFAGDGPIRLLGSVSLNGADHERCISATLLGGFVGASLGVLVGISLASNTLSRRFLLGSFPVVAAIAILLALSLWRIVGWEP